jgi:hypothetical protein
VEARPNTYGNIFETVLAANPQSQIFLYFFIQGLLYILVNAVRTFHSIFAHFLRGVQKNAHLELLTRTFVHRTSFSGSFSFSKVAGKEEVCLLFEVSVINRYRTVSTVPTTKVKTNSVVMNAFDNLNQKIA